jgi:peptidoglycan hydrolase-like protein with peptidoglycan-binding domain
VRRRTQQAPTADRIREIQRALATTGRYSGEPTGKWDAKTIEALKAFQQENGLTPTGKLDALTLQKLGLGSEVAGSAPPRPLQGTPPGTLSPRP